MSSVHDVEEEVSFPEFLKRGPEGGDQLGWKLLDEPDCVAEQHRVLLGEAAASSGRVECLEEAVARRDFGVGQCVHQR